MLAVECLVVSAGLLFGPSASHAEGQKWGSKDISDYLALAALYAAVPSPALEIDDATKNKTLVLSWSLAKKIGSYKSKGFLGLLRADAQYALVPSELRVGFGARAIYRPIAAWGGAVETGAYLSASPGGYIGAGVSREGDVLLVSLMARRILTERGERTALVLDWHLLW